MREIKFKQYLGEGNWHYWGFLEPGIFTSPLISINRGDSYQYTGLKDRHGKEIYEGDIVKEQGEYVSPYDGSSHPFSRVFAVEYKVDGYHMFTDQVNGFVEVIGDIYENPELLTN